MPSLATSPVAPVLGKYLQLWAFGHFEPHFAELFQLLVRPGDRCVDVGANIGLHTVRMAKLAGRDGAVTAIEPDPVLARPLERNLRLNELANVRLVNAAASDQPGQVTLHRPDPGDTNRARSSLHGHSYLTGGEITVPAVTVDELCRGDRIALDRVSRPTPDCGDYLAVTRETAARLPVA